MRCRFALRSAMAAMAAVGAIAVGAAGCRERAHASGSTLPKASGGSFAVPDAATGALLPIPARAQAPESPSAGWCGETAIQEGLLHLGAWAPQRLINAAGHPAHPDLYSPDIPVALSELGVRFATYQARAKGYDAFARWIRAALDEGDPVLAGVKILPTEHPDWGLDHFVLVVGYGERGLLVNTTWGHRAWVGDTTTPGLSFKNAFYALRLRGLSRPPNANPATLTLLEEGATTVKLRVACSGALTSASYRIERYASRAGTKALWSEDVKVADGHVERELVVDAAQPARFQCVPLDR